MRFKFRSRTTVFAHDVLMTAVAWFGAYWLRFNLSLIPEPFYTDLKTGLPYVVLIQAVVFWQLGLYRGVWRFSSLPDLIRIGKSVFIGICLIMAGLFLYDRLQGVPRAVPSLYVGLLLLLLSVPRLCYRFWKESILMERTGQRAIIVGAGAAGEMLARDLLSEQSGYVPVAFVDDAAHRRRCDVRGLRVVGSIDQLTVFVQSLEIEVILIAIPSATDSQMRRIVEICEQCSVPFLMLPSVKAMLSGKSTRESLRDVSIEDILSRAPIQLNWSEITEGLTGKCILVTGGGGSIGSELCKQLIRTRPGQLIILDQCEFNLYKIDSELKRINGNSSHVPVLGDVANCQTIARVMSQFSPDIVFHAAAYKHVPLLEQQICEAVRNNVLGTQTVAEAAMAAQVEKFILISTDKAVNPTNVMGATKRIAEILCQNLNGEANTRFITVRFGNVLDSAGSVVPLFRQQIKAGGPVTVTHPDISRYFMTIPESCQLIMQAGVAGQGAEVFVLDMGEPVKIAYLAEQMIRLSGKRVGEDIAINYIGLRPGEKLHEELFHEQEPLQATGYEKLLLAQARACGSSGLAENLRQLGRLCESNQTAELLGLLQRLVPEYRNPN